MPRRKALREHKSDRRFGGGAAICEAHDPLYYGLRDARLKDVPPGALTQRVFESPALKAENPAAG